MASEKLKWDQVGEKLFETGVSNGVLYPQANGAYPKGYAWNGLTSVTESPSGAEASPLYADNIKYLNLMSNEEFGASIEAYMYPDQFAECDGSAEIAPGVIVGQQKRKSFGFAYKTILGNDEDNNDYGYKLHLIYGCLAAPSDKGYSTVSDSPDAITFSWEISTTPVSVNGLKPTANITIDSTKVGEGKLAVLEDILYGLDAPDFSSDSTYAVGDYVTHETNIYKCTTAVTEAGEWSEANWTEVENPGPRLPLPDEVASIMAEESGNGVG